MNRKRGGSESSDYDTSSGSDDDSDGDSVDESTDNEEEESAEETEEEDSEEEESTEETSGTVGDSVAASTMSATISTEYGKDRIIAEKPKIAAGDSSEEEEVSSVASAGNRSAQSKRSRGRGGRSTRSQSGGRTRRKSAETDSEESTARSSVQSARGGRAGNRLAPKAVSEASTATARSRSRGFFGFRRRRGKRSRSARSGRSGRTSRSASVASSTSTIRKQHAAKPVVELQTKAPKRFFKKGHAAGMDSDVEGSETASDLPAMRDSDAGSRQAEKKNMQRYLYGTKQDSESSDLEEESSQLMSPQQVRQLKFADTIVLPNDDEVVKLQHRRSRHHGMGSQKSKSTEAGSLATGRTSVSMPDEMKKMFSSKKRRRRGRGKKKVEFEVIAPRNVKGGLFKKEETLDLEDLQVATSPRLNLNFAENFRIPTERIEGEADLYYSGDEDSSDGEGMEDKLPEEELPENWEDDGDEEDEESVEMDVKLPETLDSEMSMRKASSFRKKRTVQVHDMAKMKSQVRKRNHGDRVHIRGEWAAQVIGALEVDTEGFFYFRQDVYIEGEKKFDQFEELSKASHWNTQYEPRIVIKKMMDDFAARDAESLKLTIQLMQQRNVGDMIAHERLKRTNPARMREDGYAEDLVDHEISMASFKAMNNQFNELFAFEVWSHKLYFKENFSFVSANNHPVTVRENDYLRAINNLPLPRNKYNFFRNVVITQAQFLWDEVEDETYGYDLIRDHDSFYGKIPRKSHMPSIEKGIAAKPKEKAISIKPRLSMLSDISAVSPFAAFSPSELLDQAELEQIIDTEPDMDPVYQQMTMYAQRERAKSKEAFGRGCMWDAGYASMLVLWLLDTLTDGLVAYFFYGEGNQLDVNHRENWNFYIWVSFGLTALFTMWASDYDVMPGALKFFHLFCCLCNFGAVSYLLLFLTCPKPKRDDEALLYAYQVKIVETVTRTIPMIALAVYIVFWRREKTDSFDHADIHDLEIYIFYGVMFISVANAFTSLFAFFKEYMVEEFILLVVFVLADCGYRIWSMAYFLGVCGEFSIFEIADTNRDEQLHALVPAVGVLFCLHFGACIYGHLAAQIPETLPSLLLNSFTWSLVFSFFGMLSAFALPLHVVILKNYGLPKPAVLLESGLRVLGGGLLLYYAVEDHGDAEYPGHAFFDEPAWPDDWFFERGFPFFTGAFFALTTQIILLYMGTVFAERPITQSQHYLQHKYGDKFEEEDPVLRRKRAKLQKRREKTHEKMRKKYPKDKILFEGVHKKRSEWPENVERPMQSDLYSIVEIGLRKDDDDGHKKKEKGKFFFTRGLVRGVEAHNRMKSMSDSEGESDYNNEANNAHRLQTATKLYISPEGEGEIADLAHGTLIQILQEKDNAKRVLALTQDGGVEGWIMQTKRLKLQPAATVANWDLEEDRQYADLVGTPMDMAEESVSTEEVEEEEFIEYVDEFHELNNKTVKLMFRSGEPLGIFAFWSTGKVDKVTPENQARDLGVKPGWKIHQVQKKEYSVERLEKFMNGKKEEFELVFITNRIKSRDKFLVIKACKVRRDWRLDSETVGILYPFLVITVTEKVVRPKGEDMIRYKIKHPQYEGWVSLYNKKKERLLKKIDEREERLLKKGQYNLGHFVETDSEAVSIAHSERVV